MSRKHRLLEAEKLKWRVGRKVGRTIYAIVGSEPGDHDLLIGLMDTKMLAQRAVDAHNAALEWQWPTGPLFAREPE